MISDVQGMGMTSQRARDRLVRTLSEQGITSNKVLDVMRRTPRHLFVDEALASRAYENIALPIGYGQTISQPYIVAKMVEVLIQGRELDRVLEIGTGCGYQTVVLAQFARHVYTIERIKRLLMGAYQRFEKLSCYNISGKNADGNSGWPVHAPFDGITVTAAPMGVPEALLEQLSMNGRLIIPVGEQGRQKLLLVTRTVDGFEEEYIDSVSFVPMLSGIDTA